MKAGTGSGKTACREKVGKAGEMAANSWSANSLELRRGISTKLDMLDSHKIALGENKEQLPWYKINSVLPSYMHFCCDSSVDSSFHRHHILIIILGHKRRKWKLWKSHQSLIRLPYVTSRLNSKGKPGKVPIFPVRFKILNVIMTVDFQCLSKRIFCELF